MQLMTELAQTLTKTHRPTFVGLLAGRGSKLEVSRMRNLTEDEHDEVNALYNKLSAKITKLANKETAKVAYEVGEELQTKLSENYRFWNNYVDWKQN